jgi:hypothetical protein
VGGSPRTGVTSKSMHYCAEFLSGCVTDFLTPAYFQALWVRDCLPRPHAISISQFYLL